MKRLTVAAIPAILLAAKMSAGAEPAYPAFAPLRQDEDWSAFCHGPASGIDSAKCIPLAPEGSAYLSLGGEARERYEYMQNPGWGADPQDKNGVFLQRYVLHGDLHLSPDFRIFGQVLSALENGRAGPPGPVDENKLDLQQAFFDLTLPLSDSSSLTPRFGRQELRYGSARLVDVREGPNVRRKFDGGRVRVDAGHWRIDGIAVRPVEIRTDQFDDSSDHEQALWGAYAVKEMPDSVLGGSSLDIYYLGYQNDSARYVQGVAPEHRHTVGARLSGDHSGYDWNWEAMYQGGSFGDGDIRAWSIASDTGYTWQDAPWTPRMGLSANIASGDKNSGDNDLETFNPLFPRGNYFSELALLGPRNFFNLHPSVTVNPTDRLAITADADFFWRLEKTDGIYAPSGQLLRRGNTSDQRYVGTELSLNVSYQVNRNLSLAAIYSHFLPGRFIRQTGPSDEISYLEFTVRVLF